MAFPRRFLWVPVGWKDRGNVGIFDKNFTRGGDYTFTTEVHTTCQTRTRIGIEDGKPFTYCPMCLVKIT